MTRSPVLMLDTNTASYAIKHLYRIDEVIERYDPQDLCLSAIAEAEMLYGLRDLPEDHSLHRRVPFFLERFQRIPWDSEAAKVHAVVRHLLLSTGQPIGEMDTMIASHAIAMGITLVTNNTKHFARLAPPLRIVNWVDSAPE